MREEQITAIREDLDLLRRRFARGEIDEATYQRQRGLILADLAPEERAALGTGTPTPPPVTPAAGRTPHPVTPSALGPSGGGGRGLRTSIPSLADLDLQPGSILLGQWKLVRELGRGGFGAVFEAEELHLGERQAVKVLDPAMVAKEELLARFRREVSLMRRLEHPRIVRVFDYREDLTQLVALISMQLVAGGSVKQLLAAARAKRVEIPVPLALEILGQTLEALAEAHSQGVIHRDVTPGNVLLAGGAPEELLAQPGRDLQVKLVDFGIAGLVERSELSQKSRVLGTAAYVAPEVLDPAVEVTPAADVYGAGALAYELLTGQLPVGRFEAVAELRSEVAQPLDDLVMSLLEKRPERRPRAKPGAAGLRTLREQAAQAAARRDAERLEDAEKAIREAEATRQRAAAEARHRAEAEAAESRRVQEVQLREREEQARRAELERRRQAEAAREAEAERRTEAARMAGEARLAANEMVRGVAAGQFGERGHGLSAGARVAIVALLLVVVLGVGWGYQQQRKAERQQVAAEQQRLAAIEAEQKKAAEALEAERQRQNQVLEAERQRAAATATQAERERMAHEQEQARAAETVRQLEERRAAEAAAQAERERMAREQERARAAETARQREEQRAAEAAAQKERTPESARPAAPIEAPVSASVPAPPPSVGGVAGIRWVRIPSGSFTMGCTLGDSECRGDERPPHRVTIGRSFEMATTETTVTQYRACVAARRCPEAERGQDGGEHPVVRVSWEDARAFCGWAGGRLPSEAEWEYAARGGREGWKYPWGNAISHEDSNYGSEKCCGGLAQGRDQWERTSPVGSFAENGFGLYDMSGNVWEWVSDGWHGDYSGAPSDGNPWASGSNPGRVLRGGSWGDSPGLLRMSSRGLGAPGVRNVSLGFRCARAGKP